MKEDIITDPDELNLGFEVLIDCENKTIELVDNYDNDFSNITNKVDVHALYSFFMEEWRINVELMKYMFPFFVSDFSVLFTNGWKPKNQKTIDLLDGRFMFEYENDMFYCNTDVEELKQVAVTGCRRMIDEFNSRIKANQRELDKCRSIVSSLEDNINRLDVIEGEKEMIDALFNLQIVKKHE